MSSCYRHNAHWAGARAEHCEACGETFTGSTAGDMHRVGDHAVDTGPNRRRCLTPAEMAGVKGMTYTVNTRGTRIWSTGRTQERPFYVSQDDLGAPSSAPVGDSLTGSLKGA